jgi:hypothetical protein
MNFKLGFLIAILCLSVFPACSSSAPEQREISLETKDDTSHLASAEVRLDDVKSLADINSPAGGETPRDVVMPGVDNSQITVMLDKFGNKAESREFRAHSRIICVVLETGSDGKRQVKVYGQNGDVKTLPASMFDRAMTANGDEIANAAGIYSGRPMRFTSSSTTLAENQPTSTVPSSRPLQTTVQPTETVQEDQPSAETQKDTNVTQTVAPTVETVKIARKEDEEDK